MSDDKIILTDSDITSRSDYQQWEAVFMTWLKNYKSENTRKKYRDIVREFFLWVDKWFTDVTQLDVIDWRDYLQEKREIEVRPVNGTPYFQRRTLSDASINLFLSALSSFYNFAKERQLVSENPVDGVKRHAINPYGRATYLSIDAEEDLRLLRKIEKNTLMGLRDRAIILTMLTTAVRVSAIAEARVADIVELNGKWHLLYRNKGGEQQLALLTAPILNAIKAYLAERDTPAADDPLFASVRHHSRTGWELSGTAITNMVARRAKAAGLHHITAHSLRHTAAIQAIEHGSIGDVQKLLKHKSNRVTLIYIDHIDDDKADEMTKKLSSRYD